MTRRERVLCALEHEQPDRTPTDFQAVGEIWARLCEHYHTHQPEDILDALEIDCAWVDPEVSRTPDQTDENGLLIGWGGSKMQTVNNMYGAYTQIVHYVTSGCSTPDEIDAVLQLPDLETYDFSLVQRVCEKNDDRFLLGGFASIFYYPTLVRSMEDILLDMTLTPELARHLFNRCFQWHMDYHTRLLKAADGRLDCMQLADDFSTQTGLLISVDMFREFFKEPIRTYIELANSYGAKTMFHCCGSAYRLIPEFIDLGVDMLDPVQTTTANMEPARLKSDFGDRISFHGGGETQRILPRGTPDEVRDNARMLSSVLGKEGGYVMSSCHFSQADVPLANLLAFYDLRNR
jgi:uroporphyrinogen decarboxylase